MGSLGVEAPDISSAPLKSLTPIKLNAWDTVLIVRAIGTFNIFMVFLRDFIGDTYTTNIITHAYPSVSFTYTYR